MKNLAPIITAVLLASCADSVITPKSYDAAFELCKPHGGLVWVTRVESTFADDKIKIVCKDDEITAFRTVKITTPQPLATPASQ